MSMIMIPGGRGAHYLLLMVLFFLDGLGSCSIMLITLPVFSPRVRDAGFDPSGSRVW